jgi:PEP-CTERM motif
MGSLFLALVLCDVATAELVFEKGGGSTLQSVPVGGSFIDDDATHAINLGPAYNLGAPFGGKFYGQPVSIIGNPTSTLYVAENGNLNFSNDGSFFPTSPLSPIVPRIAPLWDDVLLLEGFNSRIVNYSMPGKYLAVGWENVLMHLNSGIVPAPRTSFQAVWFEADTVLRGYSFLKDDIIFGYEGAGAFQNRFGNLDSLVGVTDGPANFSPLPGSINGHIMTDHGSSPMDDAQIANSALLSNLLAWEDRSFLLFRPKADPTQGYDSSKEFFPAAVPEPTTTVVMAFGLLSYTQWRRRRKPMQRRRPISSWRSRRSQGR